LKDKLNMEILRAAAIVRSYLLKDMQMFHVILVKEVSLVVIETVKTLMLMEVEQRVRHQEET